MNIVFDVGGVILEWNPEKTIKSFFHEEKDHNRILEEVFKHEDWRSFDRGTISQKKVAANIADRLGKTVEDIEKFLEDSLDSLIEKSETLKLLEELESEGHRLFVLSNMPLETTRILRAKFSFWDLFEGIVFSSEVNQIKPEAEIFLHLLDKYSLTPKETIFIDDYKENIEAAEELGIKAVHFTTVAGLKKDLARVYT